MARVGLSSALRFHLLEFRVLGQLEVVRDGQPLPLGGRKQQKLLCRLLLEPNQIVSVDRLVDDLWDEDTPSHPSGVLQVHISNLRRVLEFGDDGKPPGKVLVTARPGYVLRIDPDQVDACRFERLASEGAVALAQGEPERAWQLLIAALDLCRGPAFGDLAFERFARAEATRLEDLRLGVIEDRMDCALVLGRHTRVVADLQSLVSAHPLRERLRGQLMLALYRSGRQVEALSVYEGGRVLLRDELGVDPAPALTALQESILRQERTLDWTATRDRGPARVELAKQEDADRGGGATELIGRDEQLAVLRERFSHVLAGRPQVMLIAGEAGVGKTRLAEEFGRESAPLAEVVWAHCWQADVAPAFWLWRQVLRRLLTRFEEDVLRNVLGPVAPELAQVVPELQPLLPAQDPSGRDPTTGRFHFYESITRLLVQLAEHTPLILVLDDLHWADPASLELLDFFVAELDLLVSQAEDARILVVATYRDADDPAPCAALAPTLAGLARRSLVGHLTLENLSLSDIARFTAAVTGRDPSAELVAAVQERSEGNPYFIMELVRYLQGEGKISDAVAAEIVREELPVGIRDVLRRRLGGLPQPVLRVLQVAAVAGSEFRLSVVASASCLTEQEALQLLEPALRAHVVVDVPGVAGSYHFTHVLLHQTLYDDLALADLVERHRLIGETLEAASSVDDLPVFEVAHHFWKAAHVGSVEKGLDYAVRAAKYAMAGLAHEQAEEQLERALQLVARLPPGPERAQRELPLQIELSLLIAMTRGYSDPGVERACVRAKELCRQVGDIEQLLAPLWRLAQCFYVRSELSKTEALGERLLEVGDDRLNPAFVVAGRAALGIVAFKRGQFAMARDHLEAARAVLRGRHDASLTQTFGQDPNVFCAGFLAIVLWELGERAEPAELTADALALAHQLSHPFTTTLALYFEAWLGVLRRDPSLVRARAEETIVLSRRYGFRLFEAIGAILRGWALAQEGDVEAGLAELDRGLASHASLGASNAKPFYLALLAEAYRAAGRAKEGLAVVDEALLKSEQSGERFYDVELNQLREQLLCQTGRV